MPPAGTKAPPTPKAPSAKRLPPCARKALELANLGYHPVPVEAGGKKPIPAFRVSGPKPHFVESLRTPEGIEAAFSEFPQANLGVCLPGLVQVDLDTAEAVEAVRALNLPRTPTIETPKALHGKGGVRMIFRDHGGLLTKAAGTGKVVGIEWSRGASMIGVVAPSFVEGEQGGMYSTIVDFSEAEPANLDLLPALVDLLRPAAKKPTGNGALPKYVPNGERNTTLASVAALLRSAGLDEHELGAALAAMNNGKRVEGRLPDSEVRSLTASAMKVQPMPWSGPERLRWIEALRVRHGLTRDGIAVLGYLRDRAAPDAEGWACDPGPALATIGEAIGSRDGARRGVAELERVGLLERVKRGARKPTRYELRF